ncbi:MAG: type II toxin-antitoxin system VapC family toxin [Terriglobales bacterium]
MIRVIAVLAFAAMLLPTFSLAQTVPVRPFHDVSLSPISIWEALTLNAKGRVRLRGNLAEWVAQATAPFREAPLTHEIACLARQLPLSHQDPADRFLAATAQVLGLTLVTADARLLGLGDIATLGNR